MSAVLGIRQAFCCDRNSLPTTPIYIVPQGLGDEGKLEILENHISGNNDEYFPSETNFKVSWKTFQMDMYILGRLIFFGQIRGADFEVTTEKTGLTYAGCYKFTGEKFLGIDWTWLESKAERSCEVIGEAAYPDDEAKVLIQSAIVNTPTNLVPLGFLQKGKFTGNLVKPYFGHAKSPAGVILCNGEEIVDRKLTIKPVTAKINYNRSKTNYININLELTIDQTKSQDLLNYLNKSRLAYVELFEKFGVSSGYTYKFHDGVLWRKHSQTVGKSEGNVKLSFNRNVTSSDVVVDGATGTVNVYDTL